MDPGRGLIVSVLPGMPGPVLPIRARGSRYRGGLLFLCGLFSFYFVILEVMRRLDLSHTEIL